MAHLKNNKIGYIRLLQEVYDKMDNDKVKIDSLSKNVLKKVKRDLLSIISLTNSINMGIPTVKKDYVKQINGMIKVLIAISNRCKNITIPFKYYINRLKTFAKNNINT
jgi:hypothetical protein